MKSTLIMGILAGSIALTGCGNMDTTYIASTKKEVAKSQVVGYAVAHASKTPNMRCFTVKDIWKGKGSEVASKLGVTNGMQFSVHGFHSDADLPEGAIFLFVVNATNQIESIETITIRSGRVGRMTVKEFRARIGL